MKKNLLTTFWFTLVVGCVGTFSIFFRSWLITTTGESACNRSVWGWELDLRR